MKNYFVYILTNNRNNVLYVGVTSDINKRVWQHLQKSVKSFTKKYNITKLVYYEIFDNVEQAIHREKRLKKYKKE